MKKKAKKKLFCKHCNALTEHKHTSLIDDIKPEDLEIEVPDLKFEVPDLKFEVPDLKLDSEEFDNLLGGWECAECGESPEEAPSTLKKR